MDSKAPQITAPKSFVFVLMPFDPAFDDIYKYGIKGAAEDVGAYAERVDEQMFAEGILERIFNQINKADVIVADMTGQRANVFYEVGYAHALNKIVLLLAETEKDIPFDLIHQSTTIYGAGGGRIDRVRTGLGVRLRWAIEEARRRGQEAGAEERFVVSLLGRELPEIRHISDDQMIPSFPMVQSDLLLDMKVSLNFHVRNVGTEQSQTISYIYLFTEENSPLVPTKAVSDIETQTFYEVPKSQLYQDL